MSCNAAGSELRAGRGEGTPHEKFQPKCPSGALPTGWGQDRVWCAVLAMAQHAGTKLGTASTPHCPQLGSELMEVLGAMPTWGYINVKAFYISLFYLQIIYI